MFNEYEPWKEILIWAAFIAWAVIALKSSRSIHKWPIKKITSATYKGTRYEVGVNQVKKIKEKNGKLIITFANEKVISGDDISYSYSCGGMHCSNVPFVQKGAKGLTLNRENVK